MESGIKNFYNTLKTAQLNPRTIGQSDYPTESPLDDVIKLMQKCQGTIVLGIPQISISSGTIKDQDISDNIVLGTEWNHIESALAYSIDHPMLMIRHETVSRGVFDRGTCNVFIHTVNMEDPAWALDDQIVGALKMWQSKLPT